LENNMRRNELKGKIVSRYGSQNRFAEAIGWSKQRLSRFVTGERTPNLEDIKTMSVALGLSYEEFKLIFLPWLSPNGDKED